ncbi:MAG: dihydroorotate dehydrogenase electron transfer subunit [Thermoplasmata archaeon]
MREVCSIRERIVETPSTVTLRFDYEPAAEPGQFVMVWIPGDDEIPMSLSYVGRSKGVTIKVMGPTSRNIQTLPVGERMGIRGPYGNHFDLSPRRILVVAGGSGAAVLAPAAQAARDAGSRLTVALGATTATELLFAERFRTMGARVVTATDDGSHGVHGFVTIPTEALLTVDTFDAVWTCGPEIMMRKVVTLAAQRGVPTYCSVERHMKCALGLCDACAIGPLHVCVDGPVFAAERLVGLPEFGTRKRDPSGRRVPH